MTTSLVALCFIFFYTINAQKIDVLLVEYPNKLTFFNEFEQKIETPTFASLTPFQILERNTTLSDNLTKCISVKFKKNIFFILKNSKKELVNASSAGLIQVLKNVQYKEEETQLKNRTKYYSNIYQLNTNGRVNSGLYKRFLELNKHSLIQFANHKFVWVSTKSLEIAKINMVEENIDVSLVKQIKLRFEVSNKRYRKIIKSMGIDEKIPTWIYKENSDSKYYILKANERSVSKELFDEMKRYLDAEKYSDYLIFKPDSFEVWFK